jgi:pimeloyl-ACP methyl ester carboxylesterase
MSSALTQLELATALSDEYTVYLFSRRGRGLSDPYPESLTSIQYLKSPPSAEDQKATRTVYHPAFSAQVLEIDLRDVAALMRHTSASSILGVSGGALLVLEAYIRRPVLMPPIHKAIIFEPPLLFDSLTTDTKSIDLSGLRRYEQEIQDGDIAEALVTAMKLAQLGPGWLRACPRWIIKSLTKMIMNAEAKEQAKRKAEGSDDQGAVTMESLAPVLRYDFALSEAMIGEPDRFRDVGKGEGEEILLLGGELSPQYIRDALGKLESVMMGKGNNVKRVEVKGVGHELLENKIRNGKAEKGAAIVREFLRGGSGALR